MSKKEIIEDMKKIIEVLNEYKAELKQIKIDLMQARLRNLAVIDFADSIEAIEKKIQIKIEVIDAVVNNK